MVVAVAMNQFWRCPWLKGGASCNSTKWLIQKTWKLHNQIYGWLHAKTHQLWSLDFLITPVNWFNRSPSEGKWSFRYFCYNLPFVLIFLWPFNNIHTEFLPFHLNIRLKLYVSTGLLFSRTEIKWKKPHKVAQYFYWHHTDFIYWFYCGNNRTFHSISKWLIFLW